MLSIRKPAVSSALTTDGHAGDRHRYDTGRPARCCSPSAREDTAQTTAASSDTSAPDGASFTLRDGESPFCRTRRFDVSTPVARLDPERYQRDFAKLAAEVIANLAGLLGTDVEISVEVKATNAEGFPDHVTRTVTENARTLKLDSYGFETD